MEHGMHKTPSGKKMADKDMPSYNEMKKHVMKLRSAKKK